MGNRSAKSKCCQECKLKDLFWGAQPHRLRREDVAALWPLG